MITATKAMHAPQHLWQKLATTARGSQFIALLALYTTAIHNMITSIDSISEQMLLVNLSKKSVSCIWQQKVTSFKIVPMTNHCTSYNHQDNIPWWIQFWKYINIKTYRMLTVHTLYTVVNIPHKNGVRGIPKMKTFHNLCIYCIYAFTFYLQYSFAGDITSV